MTTFNVAELLVYGLLAMLVIVAGLPAMAQPDPYDSEPP